MNDDSSATRHQPVLVPELLPFLPKKGIFIDATVGDGGHLIAMRAARPDATIIGLDRDPVSLQRTRRFAGDCQLRRGSFSDLVSLLTAAELKATTFVLLDLGFSSAQVEAADRGFSFQTDGPLDMRYDQSDLSRPTAADLINRLSRSSLEALMRQEGEERLAKRLAAKIVQERRRQPFKTTRALADFVAANYARPPRGQQWRIHPATRLFQALRIAVNEELLHLQSFLREVLPALPSGCLVAIISFHSLEDRLVKKGFLALAKPAPDAYGEKVAPRAKLLTKKPIVASAEEKAGNRRARSAKMRVLQLQ